MSDAARYRLGFCAVLALSALLNLIGLGARGLRSEEVRWAQIPREMLAHADYLNPTVNGQPFYDKPLGSYWLILAAAGACGGLSEFAARLPSALSGVVAVGLLMLTVRRLGGERQSLFAGAVLATSFGFVFYARTASTDAETVAGVLAALFIAARHDGRAGADETPPLSSRAAWWPVGFWAVLALTSLTKGLLGFALPLLIWGLYRLSAPWEGDAGAGFVRRALGRQRWLLNPATAVGVAVGAAVYALPFLLSYRQTGSLEGLAMVWRENVRRFFDAHNHRGPVTLYTYVVFGLAAPWGVLLPAALVHGFRAVPGEDGRLRRLALAYFWGVFAFFTLSSSRRAYYLLPILPAVAMLLGRLLTTPTAELSALTRWLIRLGLVAVAVGVVLTGGVLAVPVASWPAPWDRSPGVPVPWALAAVLAAVACTLAAVAWRFTMPRVWAATLTLAVGSMGYFFGVALPATECYRSQRPFVQGLREELGAEPALILYRTREVVYDLAPAGPLPEAATPEALKLRLGESAARWVLARERDLPEVGFAGHVVRREAAFAWDAPDVGASKLVLLEIDR